MYKERKKLFFENHIKPLYQGIYSSSPSGDEEVIVSELDDYFSQNEEDPNSAKWGNIKNQWAQTNKFPKSSGEVHG